MNKRRIRINESHLNRVIKEAIRKVLNEVENEITYRVVGYANVIIEPVKCYPLRGTDKKGPSVCGHFERETDRTITKYSSDNIDDLIEQIAKSYGFNERNKGTKIHVRHFDNYTEVVMVKYTNKNKRQFSDEEFDKWENNEIEGFMYTMKFNITRVYS